MRREYDFSKGVCLESMQSGMAKARTWCCSIQT